MNQQERMEAIVTYLIDHKSISIDEICRKFNVSRDTARRDLVNLEENGRIVRTRGGAMRMNLARDIQSYEKRIQNLTEEHKEIGRMAANFIRTGERLVLDASTTVQTCASAMIHKECTVITNSLNQAALLGSYPAVTIYLTGGKLHKSHRYLYGQETIDSLAQYFTDKAFIGAVGISVNGISVAHTEDASVKRMMIKQAKEVFVLADHTKFGRDDFVKAAGLEDIDWIITDKRVDKEFKAFAEKTNVKVLSVES